MKSAWLLGLSIACLAIVALAVGVRAIAGWPEHARLRGAALGATAAFALFLVIWLPGGPLGHGWAQRSGTPTSLLGRRHAHHLREGQTMSAPDQSSRRPATAARRDARHGRAGLAEHLAIHGELPSPARAASGAAPGR